MLRNEVGWLDKDENNADTLSMRLANDATFVRAAFSNHLSIFIQDTAAVSVALIGMLLGWRVALVALATLPVLVICYCTGITPSLLSLKNAVLTEILMHVMGFLRTTQSVWLDVGLERAW
jgi:hypothetical protein